MTRTIMSKETEFSKTKPIEFKSVDHFYSVIRYMTKTYGHGNWKMNKRGIKRKLDAGKTVSTSIVLLIETTDDMDMLATYLMLLG